MPRLCRLTAVLQLLRGSFRAYETLDVVRTFGIFLMETAQKNQMIKQNLPMYTITTTLGSEIRKFTAVNSSLSAGIPVLVKLLYLMESCNVYSHSHRKSFFVFTNISALRIFCLSRAVLSLTSEISAEKSSAAHRRTVSNVSNVLAAILLQQWQNEYVLLPFVA